jgi:hypothetical protein
MQPTSPDDRGKRQDGVSPTARWLVHGAWKIALAVVVILLIGGLIVALTD